LIGSWKWANASSPTAIFASFELKVSFFLVFAFIPLPAYSLSKTGLKAVMMNIAVEYAPKRIRANSSSPGLIETPLTHHPAAGFDDAGAGGKSTPEEMIAEGNKRCPTGRMGEPWDVACAAAFPASDEAKYLNGQNTMVDGGLSLTTH
jgi:NAD(P)-dependent dehydrogenase (short-subunit alcohol dehydrogenase family)